LKLGQCFFTPETDTVPRHLCVVVTDPDLSPQVAFVNFSTVPGPDNPMLPDAVIRAKEHPSLLKPVSFVRCELARVSLAQDLDRLLTVRQLSPTKPAPPELLAKVRRALLASRHTPIEVKDLLKAQQPVTESASAEEGLP
jgi:hypothetical protein